MARDYSSRPSGSPSKNGKRKPTRAKTTAKRSGGGGGPPGWVWMICGLCIGLTVAAGLYIFARPAGTPAREQVQIATPTIAEPDDEKQDSAKSEKAAQAEKPEEEPRFSFYKMLPNYEVVIPQEEYPEKKASASSGQTSSTPAGEPPPSTPQPTTPKVKEPGDYIIQAGSFSTREDADRRKAELGLLGLAARITEVDLSSGKTVYRVRSNTISSRSKLNELLGRLRENRIDTLVMRARQ